MQNVMVQGFLLQQRQYLLYIDCFYSMILLELWKSLFGTVIFLSRRYTAECEDCEAGSEVGT